MEVGKRAESNRIGRREKEQGGVENGILNKKHLYGVTSQKMNSIRLKEQTNNRMKRTESRNRSNQAEGRAEHRGRQAISCSKIERKCNTAAHRAIGCSRRTWMTETGIETQPGPRRWGMRQAINCIWGNGMCQNLQEPQHETSQEQQKEMQPTFKFKTINILSLNRHAERLRQTDGHTIFIQEHAASKQIANRWKTRMKEKGWGMHISPLGNKKRGTGVGALVREPIQAIPIK